jgi:hypothetical protein
MRPNPIQWLVVGTLFLSGAEAATPAPWANEPTSVLGIELGTVIRDNIPDCPQRKRGDLTSPSQFCKRIGTLVREGQGYIDFDAIPMGAILSTITAYTYDDAVGSVHALAPHRNYSDLRAALVERFGPPSTVSTSTVKTTAGVELSSELVEWVGKAVSIQLHERFERITTCAMIASHLPTLAKHADREDARIKKAAAEL